MADGLEMITRAGVTEERPETVFVSMEYEGVNVSEDIPLVATDSAELASWLADAINAIAEGVRHEAPRPRGSIVQRGYFEYYYSEPSKHYPAGEHYCAATGYTMSLAGDGGFNLGVSDDDRALVERVVDELNTLIGAVPMEGGLEREST